MQARDDGTLELTPAEIEKTVEIGRVLKERFSEIVTQVAADARAQGISDHVVTSAFTAEGLLLAASFWCGTEESFVEMARRARVGLLVHRVMEAGGSIERRQ